MSSGTGEPFFPIDSIETYLEKCLRDPATPTGLAEACRYAVRSGGKRLRPTLAWHACEAVGGMGEESLPAGAAVELVHAFSLVHDDLPAIDNDDLRRGRPTLHRHAGEAMAILAGDALLAAAFELLARAPLDVAFQARQKTVGLMTRMAAPLVAAAVEIERAQSDVDLLRLQLIRELSGATVSMIHGQVWDTLAGLPPGVAPEEQLRLIHRNKTGALILAACRMGALAALGPHRDEAGETKLARIDDYGRAIGLMFQIVDDLIDVTQTVEHAGKKTGKDAHAGKLTYPGLLGIDASRRHVSELQAQAHAAAHALGPSAQGLHELCDFLATRTK